MQKKKKKPILPPINIIFCPYDRESERQIYKPRVRSNILPTPIIIQEPEPLPLPDPEPLPDPILSQIIFYPTETTIRYIESGFNNRIVTYSSADNNEWSRIGPPPIFEASGGPFNEPYIAESSEIYIGNDSIVYELGGLSAINNVDMTMEGWFRLPSDWGGRGMDALPFWIDSGLTHQYSFIMPMILEGDSYTNNNDWIYGMQYSDLSGIGYFTEVPPNSLKNQWLHYSYDRRDGVGYFRLNGVLINTGIDFEYGDNGDGSTDLSNGYFYIHPGDCDIGQIRITVGTSLYAPDSNQIPTTPFLIPLPEFISTTSCNIETDTSSKTDFSYAWYKCDALTSFPLLDTSSGTNFSYAWGDCEALTSFAEIDTSSGTNFTYAWNNCRSLTSFPLLDTSSGTNFTYAWNNCRSLTSFPLLDTSSGTNFGGAWYYCFGLTEFPLLDVSSGTNFMLSWWYCSGLTSFPLLDVSSGTDFSYAWYYCSGLTEFPLLDVSSGTNFGGAWSNTNLTSFPLLDVSSGTNFGGAWFSCYSLTSFPLLDVSSGTNFMLSWNNCRSLTSFPLLDTSSGTNFSGAWARCHGLTSFPLLDTSSGTNFSFAWNNCRSLTSFPLLDTSSGTNFSYAWDRCSSLTSFPLLDTSSGTDFERAWWNCSGLTSFPLLDTSSGTDFGGAWYYCSGLTSFPLLDVSSGTNFGGAWYYCTSLTSFPANMFDTCLATNFDGSWNNCALNTTSVNNILISLDTAGQSNGTVSIDGGTNAAPTGAGLTAKANLEGKGWVVATNLVSLTLVPQAIFATYTQSSVWGTNSEATLAKMQDGIGGSESSQTGTQLDTIAWVMMDFGAVTSFSSITVGAHSSALNGGWGSTGQYINNSPIQASNDAVTWTTIGNTGTMPTTGERIATFATPGANYRYVRISRNNGYLALTEFYALP